MLIKILLITAALLSGCKSPIGGESSVDQDFLQNSSAPVGLVLISGAYQYPDGTYADSCLEYLNSSFYNIQGDGAYWIDPDGAGGLAPMKSQCDMSEDNGGWTLVLNYLHQGGTNPALAIRTTTLPLIQSSTLGDDESSNTDTWGHTGNALLSAMNFTELRFSCVSNGHTRIMNFKTSSANVIAYLKTGTGSFGGIGTSFSPLLYHDSMLPAVVSSGYINKGNLAMTNFPFYQPGNKHWGIKGVNLRWECDDYPGNFNLHTLHRIWVR